MEDEDGKQESDDPGLLTGSKIAVTDPVEELFDHGSEGLLLAQSTEYQIVSESAVTGPSEELLSQDSENKMIREIVVIDPKGGLLAEDTEDQINSESAGLSEGLFLQDTEVQIIGEIAATDSVEGLLAQEPEDQIGVTDPSSGLLDRNPEVQMISEIAVTDPSAGLLAEGHGIQMMSAIGDTAPSAGLLVEGPMDQIVSKKTVSDSTTGLSTPALHPPVGNSVVPRLTACAHAALGGRLSFEEIKLHIIASGCVLPPCLRPTNTLLSRGATDCARLNSLAGPAVSLGGCSAPLGRRSVPLPQRSVLLTGRSVLLSGRSVPLPGLSVSLAGSSLPLPGLSVPLVGRSFSLAASSIPLIGAPVSSSSRSVPLAKPTVPMAGPPVNLANPSVKLPTSSVSLFGSSVPVAKPTVPLVGRSYSLPGSSVPLALPVAGRSYSLSGSSVPVTGQTIPLPGCLGHHSLPGTSASVAGLTVPLSGRSFLLPGSSVPMPGSSVPVSRRLYTLFESSVPLPGHSSAWAGSSVPVAGPSVPSAGPSVSMANHSFSLPGSSASVARPSASLAKRPERLGGPGFYHQGFTLNSQPPQSSTGVKPRAITKNGAKVKDAMIINPAPDQFPEQRCFDYSSRSSERYATATWMARPFTAVTTLHGTICLLLKGGIRIDFTIDQAVRVLNFRNNIQIAMSNCGNSVGMVHPNVRIRQQQDDVTVAVFDRMGLENHKYAKFVNKGVSFMSDKGAVTFFLDDSGPRTMSHWDHMPLYEDFPVDVFYEGSLHGPQYQADAATILHASKYWRSEDGEYNWCINGTRISQTKRGLVTVSRFDNKNCIETSSRSYRTSISTPLIHVTTTLKNDSNHVFTRFGNRRIHYNGRLFTVRVAGNAAGFNDRDQLQVY